MYCAAGDIPFTLLFNEQLRQGKVSGSKKVIPDFFFINDQTGFVQAYLFLSPRLTIMSNQFLWIAKSLK